MAYKKRLVGVVALAAGMLVMGTASAWWGWGWYRPLGAGAMTYERQTTMRRHGYSMDDLSRMFTGQRAFDRDEAARLARELAAGFGPHLAQNTQPGAVVAGSRAVPWTWRNFGAFQGWNEASRQSALRLAELLEKPPGVAGDEPRLYYNPGPPRPTGRLSMPVDRAIPVDAVEEYRRLDASCRVCHGMFRGYRW